MDVSIQICPLYFPHTPCANGGCDSLLINIPISLSPADQDLLATVCKRLPSALFDAFKRIACIIGAGPEAIWIVRAHAHYDTGPQLRTRHLGIRAPGMPSCEGQRRWLGHRIRAETHCKVISQRARSLWRNRPVRVPPLMVDFVIMQFRYSGVVVAMCLRNILEYRLDWCVSLLYRSGRISP